MKLKLRLPGRGNGVQEQPPIDDDGDEEATVSTSVSEHKPTLSRNIHWVVLAFIALAIGGATYYTSAKKQESANSATAEKKDAEVMSADDARRKSDTASSEVSNLADRQVRAVEKKREMASASASSSPSAKQTASYQSPFKTDATNSVASTGITDQGRLTRAGAVPPPPPPPHGAQPTPIDGTQPVINPQYSPAAISELGVSQGGQKDGLVQQRTSSIIALTGSVNNSGGGSTAAGRALAADTANVMSATAGHLVEAASNNQAAIFAPMQQKMYPAQADLEQVRARLESLRAIYGAGASQTVNTLPSPVMGNQPAPQLGGMPPAAAITQTRPQYLEPVKYDGRLLIRQGKFIPAAFLTAINSDLPGDISAIVTENVYDSVGGDTLLIPKGSMLLATYGSDILIGQERILINFNRIVLPNGSYVDLGTMNGIDAIGQSGSSADVNNHFLKQFGAGLVGAVVAWGVDKAAASNITINTSNNSQTDLTTSSGKVIKDLTDRILERYKNLKPTLTVAPGEKIRLFVGRDIAMPAYQ